MKQINQLHKEELLHCSLHRIFHPKKDHHTSM